MSYGRDSVETADHEQHFVNHFYGEVASWIAHLHYGRPLVGGWVELFASVHSGQSVEATQHVQVVVVRDARHAAASSAHRRYQHPLVGFRVVSLYRA